MSRLTDDVMQQLANAISHTLEDQVGHGIGFIFFAVDDNQETGDVDFQYISNIKEQSTIKELLTHVVTSGETQN